MTFFFLSNRLPKLVAVREEADQILWVFCVLPSRRAGWVHIILVDTPIDEGVRCMQADSRYNKNTQI
jgi:hypothetical protein